MTFKGFSGISLLLFLSGCVSSGQQAQPVAKQAAAAPTPTGTPSEVAGLVVANPVAEDSKSEVLHLAISANREWLAVVTGRDVKLWNISSGELAGQLDCSAGYEAQSASSLAQFSSDSQTLAVAYQNRALLWDLSSPERIRQPESVKIIGKPLPQDYVKVMNRYSGTDFRETTTSVAFSPDGKMLGTAGTARATAKLWEVPSGRQLHVLGGREDFDDSHIVFSPDGKAVATWNGNQHRVAVWDAKRGKLLRVLHKFGRYPLIWCDFIGDARTMGLAFTNGDIEVKDVASGKLKRVWRAFPDEAISPVRSASAGAIWGRLYNSEDLRSPLLRLRDARSGKVVGGVMSRLLGSSSPPGRFALSPDGRLAATWQYSNSSLVRLWDVTTHKWLRSFPVDKFDRLYRQKLRQ